jgi:hypothetical protein
VQGIFWKIISSHTCRRVTSLYLGSRDDWKIRYLDIKWKEEAEMLKFAGHLMIYLLNYIFIFCF